VCNKELVTVVAVGPWLLYRALRRLPTFPSRRVLITLVLVGLAVQLGANTGVQWAFGVVGLAVVVPAIFGVMLTASAVMGRVLLGERVSRRSAGAIALLLGALAFLSLAAWTAGNKVSAESGPLLIALGIAAACMAGAIYAVLTITIRRAATGTTPVSAIVFLTTLMGILSLGPLSIQLLGTEELLGTPPGQLAWMYAAGTLNLIAFLAITKGLQLTTVVHANVLNATQVAMAAIAGVAIFAEPQTFWLLGGVAMTILGVVLIDRPDDGDRDADRHV
ncbi:MAG: EamA family transporter, partial [Planctomycetota bacterium]